MIIKDKKGKYIAKTPSGLPLLFECINNESEDKSKPWILDGCMTRLISSGCDIESKNIEDDTLLIYALKNNKTSAFNKLINLRNMDISVKD